jgi:hypothetical protein
MTSHTVPALEETQILKAGEQLMRVYVENIQHHGTEPASIDYRLMMRVCLFQQAQIDRLQEQVYRLAVGDPLQVPKPTDMDYDPMHDRATLIVPYQRKQDEKI